MRLCQSMRSLWFVVIRAVDVLSSVPEVLFVLSVSEDDGGTGSMESLYNVPVWTPSMTFGPFPKS